MKAFYKTEIVSELYENICDWCLSSVWRRVLYETASCQIPKGCHSNKDSMF